MKDYHVFIVSDGTGETAYRLLKAAMVQFQEDILITRYSNVRDQAQIAAVTQAASQKSTLVVYTFVSVKLRGQMERAAREAGLEYLDMLGPLMERMAAFFHTPPSAKPGLLHQVDEEYFARIDAIEFAIRHDDGRALKDIAAGDIILLGISRTSKTPLSIYLAQEGWRVANCPLLNGVKPHKEIFAADQKKIAGLTIEPHRLAEIRRVRLRQLGVKESSYADILRIQEELDFSHQIYSEHPIWPVIDVTGKSLEEVSQEVLDQLIGRGRKL